MNVPFTMLDRIVMCAFMDLRMEKRGKGGPKRGGGKKGYLRREKGVKENLIEKKGSEE